MPLAPTPAVLPPVAESRREDRGLPPGAVAGDPPQVAERPVVPPTYSAHVAAGLLPPPRADDDTTYVVADQITGINDVEVVAAGNADLRKRNKRLTADRITYRESDAEVEAAGKVRLTQDQDSIEGPYLRLNTERETGHFDQPAYRITRAAKPVSKLPGLFDEVLYPGERSLRAELPASTGSGAAERLDFEGKDRFRFTDATYSTCSAPAGQDPDWYAKAGSLELDYNESEGVARQSTVYFKGVPILYSPWLSFSLNNQRRSGLLAPSFGSSTLSGGRYAQPVYWNIAPNRDATLTPTIMSKRGTLLAGEFRYLDRTYAGQISGQYLPNDKLTGKSRDAISLNHAQNLGYGFAGALTYNAVSDYRFFSDMSNSVGAVSQTNLLKQATLTYGATWWSAQLVAQAYQTLQEPGTDPQRLNEPYRRLPQLTLAASRSDLPLGAQLGVNSEYVQFRHPTRTEASRLTVYPQISLPFSTSATTIRPKLGYHATSYSLSRQAAGTPDRLSRGVPVFSVDSNVVFERSTDWFGRAFTQTLEPRLHYLYVPVRDQSQIPVFDTGLADFNFATIFAENRYGGNDRFGDANQLTAMVASRLIDADTGAEAVRAAIGQRVYFTTQKVGLPAIGTTPAETLRTSRQTDLLGALSGRVAPNTYADLGIQYSPLYSRMERQTVGVRFQPDINRVLNASYRYNRNQIGQVDLSGQWPIGGGWNMVGRLNYSTKEHRLIENLAGLEYDAGCWAVRGVVQQFATLGAQTNRALMFQLELKGLSNISVGESVTSLLKRNIAGYGVINPSATTTTFAE